MFNRLRTAWSLFRKGLKLDTRDIPKRQDLVLYDVAIERQRQLAKWGDQSLPNNTGPLEALPQGYTYGDTLEGVRRINDLYNNPTWDYVLLEEVLEALSEKKRSNLRRELVEVAAVCVSWIEDLDRKSSNEDVPVELNFET